MKTSETATLKGVARRSRWSLGVLLACGASAGVMQQANAGAVIFNSPDPAFQTVALGVNDLGHLNFFDSTFSTVNAGATGLAAKFSDGEFYDATAPGCLCEGWGVAVTTQAGARVSGFANESSGTGGLAGGTFGATPTAATSMVTLLDAPVRVTHAYGVSLAPGVFQGNVTITNTGDSVLGDLVYRRAMDWDVPPTEFSEYVSHYGVTANLESAGGNVRFASNDGFSTSDPIVPAGVLDDASINSDFVHLGPDDQGSVFDFAFGNLAPGESRSFNIFYGAAGNEASANAAIAVLNPNVWSFGQSALNLPIDPEGGDGCGSESCPEASFAASSEAPAPAINGVTFIFAFGGVGGVEPGMSPDSPILPFVPAPGEFVFPAPVPRRWYDPPFADGFEYSLDDGEFYAVAIPDGFGTLLLEVGDFTAELDPLVEYNFLDDFGLDDVVSFRVREIPSPFLDVEDPFFASAFPTFLDFITTGELHMTALLAPNPVPIPAALPMMLGALGGLACYRRRRH